MLPKYTPSGKISPLLALGFPVLTLIAVVSSIAYFFLLAFIPFIYLDALIVIAYAGGLAFVISRGLRLSKVRNPTVGGLVGVSIGLAALLGAWSLAYFGWRLGQPEGSPVGLFDCLRDRAATGWTIGKHGTGTPLTGIFVYFIWLIEAGIILVITFGGGLDGAGTPFCERCAITAKKKDRKFLLPGLSPESIDSLAKSEDLATLLTPSLSDIRASECGVEYAVTKCPRCDSLGFLTLTNVVVTTDKRKKKETKRTELIIAVELNADEIEAIARLEVDAAEAARLNAEPSPVTV